MIDGFSIQHFGVFLADRFSTNILPLHAPIHMYNCNVKVYQKPPTMSKAPLEKNHEPLSLCCVQRSKLFFKWTLNKMVQAM